MILYDFEYIRPESLDQALSILHQHGDQARILAGGTDVVVNMKYRSMLQLFKSKPGRPARFQAADRIPPIDQPKIVVSLSAIDNLKGIKIESDKINIGPLTTMTEIAQTTDLPHALGALVDAASIMGSALIRNRATVGGNVINARPAADTLVAIMSLGATYWVQSKEETRSIDCADLIISPGKTSKKADEILTSIEIPYKKNQASAYARQGIRRQLEIALVGVSSWIELDQSQNKITDARISLGAVGPKPLLAPLAAASLIGQPPSEKSYQDAAIKARNEAHPIDDFRGTASYRLDIVEVLVKRTLSQAVSRIKGQESAERKI